MSTQPEDTKSRDDTVGFAYAILSGLKELKVDIPADTSADKALDLVTEMVKIHLNAYVEIYWRSLSND
jgi:hypothetical protein